MKRPIWILVAAAGVVLIAWLVHLRNRPQPLPNGTQVEEAQPGATEEVRTQNPNVDHSTQNAYKNNHASVSPADAVDPAAPDILTQQTLAQLSNTFQTLNSGVNRPIEFYGKVLDENDAPVAGVSAKLGWFVYPETTVHTNLTTGTMGTFSLTSATGALLMVHLNKEGYKPSATNQVQFEYYSVPGFEGMRPDSNNPVIFHLNKDVGEPPPQK